MALRHEGAGYVLDSIRSSSLVSKYGPTSDAAERLKRLGFRLPRLHEDLLALSDGVTGYGGYFRIFGVSNAVTDLAVWNDEDTWKFAWPPTIGGFFCFGETAWGDQYAYPIAELQSDNEPSVYFLESITLNPERLAANFESFVRDEFLRNCETPYDEILIAARNRFGDLEPSEHITYVPSPLVTGEESLEHVIKMPARAAMIAGGDLARQLSGELQSRQISRIEPYVDHKGRARLKVVLRQ
jgi:hypothetical protein